MSITRSLAQRLLLAAVVLLPLSLSITGLILDRAHRTALDAAAAERLQLQIVALLAQADMNANFDMSLQPLETRLLQPGSGLYAMVSDGAGNILWLSPSAALIPEPVARLNDGVPPLAPGEQFDGSYRGLMRHAYQVLWELDDGSSMPLRFLVAESAVPREAEVTAFREQLLWSLGLSLLLLLSVQFLIARWGLYPLRKLADRIALIEAGHSPDLEGQWPQEVEPLVENLETLLDGEQQRRERTRNTLADLAHSLKTPLAVLRSADPKADDAEFAQREQLDRMEEVVNWHLQRAVGGSHRLLQRVEVMPVLVRLRSTLHKVYASRDLDISVEGNDDARYRGDERDLMEILGNLLDNACKYARSRVSVTVRGGSGTEPLDICIDDDGEGISPELRDSLLLRGSRADTRLEGQGIGLAVVMELVSAHGGELQLDDSPLGGARVRLTA